ncbi:hypothetical protein XHC_1609 [Xanthomonas hortorum pv. carotae str. M081]|nr:hypothetical protein XHC_1609 [Xanthomonas hortorum pv. carotae str. M081]
MPQVDIEAVVFVLRADPDGAPSPVTQSRGVPRRLVHTRAKGPP